MERQIGGIAVELVLVHIGLNRGDGRVGCRLVGVHVGLDRVDVRLQRGVGGIAVELVLVHVGLDGIDVLLERQIGGIAVELVLIHVGLDGVHSIEVSLDLGSDDVVDVALVGEVVICNGSLRAQHVAGERCASGRDVVADGQVILNRHVGRENLAGHLELRAGCCRRIHGDRGTHFELVHIGLRAQGASVHVEMVVGFDEGVEGGQVALELGNGRIQRENVAVVALNQPEERGVLRLAGGRLSGEIGLKLGNGTGIGGHTRSVRGNRTRIGGDVRRVRGNRTRIGGHTRSVRGNVTGVGGDA